MQTKPSNKEMTPQSVEDCHQLLLWLIPLLDQFPRQRRFTLGERLESSLLEVLGLLVQAAYTSGLEKSQLLRSANRHLNVARHLWRLSFELQVVARKRYAHGSQLLVELGRQIGGWQRRLHAEAPSP